MILCGDALTMLKGLDAGCANCCITSPPYWGLRDYQTARWEGGDGACDHKVPLSRKGGNAVGTKQTTNPGSYGYREWLVCGRCGARRVDAQLGLEPTPEEYVARMVEVFREVRRVLRDDGTLWLNLGDSYCGSWGNSGNRPELDGKSAGQRPKGTDYLERGGWDSRRDVPPNQKIPGLKPKDLVGIPWRVAFALQADGWWLRQDIIWHKPNPMPESVRDRCTKAHEYVFLLSKAATYYCDMEAIAEPSTGCGGGNFSKATAEAQPNHGAMRLERPEDNGTRNRRSVWTVTTKPFKDAHFATFPPDLVKPMVLAGCPAGGTVLDPFFGAGTTGLVAQELGREYIGIELNEKYVAMARKRIGAATLGMGL